ILKEQKQKLLVCANKMHRNELIHSVSGVWLEKVSYKVHIVFFFYYCYPTGFSIFLAHEFFDALPIHKFQVSNI
ncbi:MAG: SAM-dependent methyltransferase, partial [Tannerellaceae bacterium]